MKKKESPYQILVAIINRQRVLEVTILKILSKFSVDNNIISKAYGTAPSGVSDFFGFGTTEKSIVTSIVPASKSHEILNQISMSMDKNKNNKGVAFLLPLTGMDSRIFQILGEKHE